MFSRCVNVILIVFGLSNCLTYYMKEYERTGYVWEQYDAKTGEGRRRCVIRTYSETPDSRISRPSHPFTGWTSLVTLSKYGSALRITNSSLIHEPTVISEKY